MKKLLSIAAASVLAVGLAFIPASASAQTTCTFNLANTGTCGAFDSPQTLPPSNGYNTYVNDQDVGANGGSVENGVATGPGSWTTTNNDVPYGYTGVQSFDATQQLFNNWDAVTNKGWTCQPDRCSDTPLADLSTLQVHYNETSPVGANDIYEFAPDIWDSADKGADVMFWADTSPTRCTDNGLGASNIVGQWSYAGQNWTAYSYGPAGNEVIFVLNSASNTDPMGNGTCANQSSGTIHILAGFKWLVAQHFFTGLGKLSQLNTGWEVTSAQNAAFTLNSYSITATVK